MDAQSRVEDVAALAALVQGLARHEAENDADPVAERGDRVVGVSRRARRARGRDPARRRSCRCREAARAAVELAAPHARELGSEDELAGIERILRDGNGADRQRAAHERGGMPALLEHLAEDTAAGT